jgi:hypothetical protein
MVIENERVQDVDGYHYELIGYPVSCNGSETVQPASLSAIMPSVMKIPMKYLEGSHGGVVDMVGTTTEWWTSLNYVMNYVCL